MKYESNCKQRSQQFRLPPNNPSSKLKLKHAVGKLLPAICQHATVLDGHFATPLAKPAPSEPTPPSQAPGGAKTQTRLHLAIVCLALTDRRFTHVLSSLGAGDPRILCENFSLISFSTTFALARLNEKSHWGAWPGPRPCAVDPPPPPSAPPSSPLLLALLGQVKVIYQRMPKK